MKKLFLTMLAAVTLLASCSKEETPGQINGEESLVTFTLSTSDLATKTLGDGKTAENLYYAVYNANEQIVKQVSLLKEDGVTAVSFNNLAAHVEIPLLNGEKYSILFWAENAGSVCEIDWDNKKMTYTPVSANQEAYDAFYAYVPEFTVTGSKTETVKMYRPFAQLNIGTTEGDLAELAKYNGLATDAYKYSKVKVSTKNNTLNLVTGEVSESANAVEKEYGYSVISGLASESFPVSGYKYLSMNYVLVGVNRELINVEFTIAADESGTNSVERTFDNVPVQRNYRTNIYGDLYASTMEYDVLIEPNWKEEDYYVMSGIVTLEEDLMIDKPIIINSNTTLDLNGHNIINTSTYSVDGNGNPVVGEATDCHAIVVRSGELNIKGEGKVAAMAGSKYDMAIWALGGTVNIYGGEYTNKGNVDKGCDVIYVKNGAVVNIYGGVFQAGNTNKESFANRTEGVYAALNLHGSATGAINVYGGTFINFNPAVPGTETADWNTAHPNGFVAEGFTSMGLSDGVYVVVKEDPTAQSITLNSDLNLLSSSLQVTNLDGNNNTIESFANYTVKANGGTIKNVTLNGSGDYAKDKDGNYLITSDGSKKSTRAIWLENVTQDVVIDNVIVEDAGYAFNTGSGISATAKLLVTNSTFENWMSYDGFASASFTNCNFNIGDYFTENSVFNGGIRPYVETVFENCNFAEGFKVDSYHESGNNVYAPNIKFKNCKLNGQPLSDSNIADLLYADDAEKDYNVEIL